SAAERAPRQTRRSSRATSADRVMGSTDRMSSMFLPRGFAQHHDAARGGAMVQEDGRLAADGVIGPIVERDRDLLAGGSPMPELVDDRQQLAGQRLGAQRPQPSLGPIEGLAEDQRAIRRTQQLARGLINAHEATLVIHD